MPEQTTRQILDLTISEQDFQQTVVKAARATGWRIHHSRKTRLARRDGTVRYLTAIQGDAGFPDLVLVRGGRAQRVLFRELKAQRGSLDAGQRAWRDVLLAAGADWALWRPSDWSAGVIEAELA